MIDFTIFTTLFSVFVVSYLLYILLIRLLEGTPDEFIQASEVHWICHLIDKYEECNKLGQYLGLANEINNIQKLSKKTHPSEICWKIILIWCRLFPLEASKPRLFQALRQIGRTDIVIFLENKTCNEFQLRQKTPDYDLQGKISENTLDKVCGQIGSKDWRRFIRHLGVDKHSLVWFNKRHRTFGKSEICFQFLLKWRKNLGSNATNAALVKALLVVHRIDIVENIFPGLIVVGFDEKVENQNIGLLSKAKLRRTLFNESEIVSETAIERISDEITQDEWKRLGRKLDLEYIHFVWFQRKYLVYGVSEICYQMLMDWKKKQKKLATYKVICEALRDVGRMDIVNDIAPGISLPRPNDKSKRVPGERFKQHFLTRFHNILNPNLSTNCLVLDEDIEQISERLKAGEWKRLGKLLGLNNPYLVWFNRKYIEFGVAETSYQILKTWKRTFKDRATFDQIIQVLVDIDRKDIAEELYPSIALPNPRTFPESEELIPAYSDVENLNFNKPINDDVIRIVCKYIKPGQWKELGEKLGLTEIKLKWFNYSYLDYKELTFQMLLTWQKTFTSQANMASLFQALININREDVVEAIVPGAVDLMEKMYSKSPEGLIPGIASREDLISKIKKLQKQIFQTMVTIEMPWLNFKVRPLDKLYMPLTTYAKNRQGVEEKSYASHYEDIFTPVEGKRARRIVIESQPGFGKTLLATKIAYDWSHNKDYLKSKYDLVIYVEGWQFNTCASLEDALVSNLGDDTFSIIEKLDVLMQTEDDKILLILDGFDELTEQSKLKLWPLLKGEVNPKMTVVVTSRSSALQVAGRNTDSDIGHFTEDSESQTFWKKRVVLTKIIESDRREFIENYYGNINDDLYDKISRLIQGSLRNILECPLFLLMATYLAKETSLEQCTTMTDFMKSTLQHSLRNTTRMKKLTKVQQKQDPFSIGEEITPIFVADLLGFGETALEGLILNTCLAEDQNRFFDTIQTQHVIREGLLGDKLDFSKDSKAFLCRPFHRIFLEFFAAFFLVHFAPSKPDEFKKKIAFILNNGLQPSKDSFLFPFLAGLLGSGSSIIFTTLSACSCLKPVYDHSITNILHEIAVADHLVKSLSPFIPEKWVIGFNPKFLTSPWHREILSYGTKKNKIKIVEWDLLYDCNLPDALEVDHLIFCVWHEDISRGLKAFTNAKKVTCKELLCSVGYFNENIWKSFLEMTTKLKTDKVIVDINGKSDVEVIREVIKNINTALQEGIWKDFTIDRLQILRMNEQTDSQLISLIQGLVDEGKISESLGINVLQDKYNPTQPAKICQEDEENLLRSIMESSNINSLTFVQFITDFIAELDLSPLTNNDQSSWKYIHIDGAVKLVLKHGTEMKNLPLEIMGLGKWREKFARTDIEILKYCTNIKCLECESSLFEILTKTMNSEWPGFQTMTDLSLSLIEKNYQYGLLKEINRFPNISTLTMDLLLFYQCLEPEAIKVFVSVLSHLHLKILYVKEIQFWHVDAATEIATDMFDISRNKLVYSHKDSKSEKEDTKTNFVLEELKLNFDPLRVHGNMLIKLFRRLRQLLCNKVIKRLSIVSPSSSQEEVIPNEFPMHEDFYIQRLAELSCQNDIYQSYQRFELGKPEFTSKISIIYIGK